MFAENVKGWILPHLEVAYLCNFLYLIENKPVYIDPILKRITDTMNTLVRNDPDYYENYVYLLFYQAFLLKLRGDLEQAMIILHEILSFENILEREVQILPQACFEIALIHRLNGKTSEVKRWIDKTSKYDGYLTEAIVGWRCKYVLDHLKRNDYHHPENNVNLPMEE